MSRIKDVPKAVLGAFEPVPNRYVEQANEVIGGLEPAVNVQVLAQLAVAEGINQLTNALKSLNSTISLNG